MVPIPLNGEPSFTFTQKAGEAVQLILTVDEDRPPPADTGGCNVQTSVYGVDLPLRARVDLFTNQGDPFGEGSDLGGLAAPASDTEIELRAFTSIENCEPETWGISITLTVMTLRN